MALTDRIVTKSSAEGRIVLNYGPPGTGKTSMWCQAKNAILIEVKDESSGALKEIGSIREDLPVVSTTSWEDSISILKELAETNHSYRNVIIDGVSGLNEYCDQYTIDTQCDGDSDKFVAFGRGEKLASITWQEFVQVIRDLRAKGIWVFLLGHQQIVTITNPTGDNYVKYSPAVGKDRLPQLVKYCDAIFFSSFVIATKDVDKQSGKGKVLGGERRIMYTTPSASYDAKNRLGIPGMIDLGSSPQESFQAFANAVKAARQQKG